ncbi:protein NODULATION SIGNALING PATHWAY 2-like [Salvia miltiorrhiza]|uniref:protein NODULATION SIGNALING PATHWAY 2-like n=1 Tax=Salvia miltiorrhiza TaxID=226208 RepID=UPI0025AC518B|nr:protein NODULATION SIGNALING PATHWAY 2-like [Salvia miltiorrhiza]
MDIEGVFFSSFALSEDSSMVSSDSYFPDTFPDNLFNHDSLLITSHDDGLVKILRSDIDDICDWLYAGHSEDGTCSSAVWAADEWSPSPSLESNQIAHVLTEVAIDLPRKDAKLENELTLTHLLRAFGEAMNDGNNGSLAKVIVESINEKSSPQGNLIERVAYNMFKSKDGEYLRQESVKNFATALNVLYRSLICGRFAHNAANAAILESIPEDVTVLHIVDFEIGEGIQWPALMEALSRKQKPVVRLTAIKREGEDAFEETKKRLHDHARQCGLELHIEEKCIQEFAAEMRRRKRKRENGGGRDWLVFNAMVALPHMGRRRRRSGVVEFLKVAEGLLAKYEGILSLGDGEAGVKWGNCVSYESYFGELVEHYQALFESLECNLPVYLGEARTAMECLFLAPLMCPFAWFEEWEEKVKGVEFESVLEGRRASEESLAEAKLMVDERENWYSVRIEGLRENEMVLRWKETMLVRVSIFCSRLL